MAGVIFKNTSRTVYDNQIVCKIIDDAAGSDTDTDFDIAMPGWTITQEGDKMNPFHYIYTTHVSCNMVLETEAQYSWFDALKTADEGRYFVQIEVNSGIWFKGKIIHEDMTLDDAYKPVFSFSAIDGLTDLKGKDYEHYLDVTIIDPVLYVYKSIFSLLPTYDYLGPGTAMAFQSDIVPDNISTYAGNLLACQYVTPYFYKKENNKRVPMTAWETLEEILKRMHCSIKYFLNVYWITGLEGIHNTRVEDYHVYDKDCTFIATSGLIANNVQDLDNSDHKVLSGGKYYYSSGYNRVTIESDKVFSNRRQGDGIYWTLAWFTAVSGTYKDIGVAKEDIAYNVRININITNVLKSNPSQSIPAFFNLKLNMRVVGGAALETDKIYKVPTVPGKYFYEIKIDSDVAGREIEAKWDIETIPSPNNLSKIDVIVDMAMTELTQIYDKVKVISTIAGSKNPKTKTITTYGNHHNGTEAVRWYYGTGVGDFEETKDYSFSGGAIKGYEQLLAENILAYSGPTESLEITYNDVLFPDPFATFSYSGIDYMLSGYTIHLHEAKSDLSLIKINSAQAGTITTEQEVPLESDINEPTSSIIGNIILYVNKYQEEFEDVTAEYVEPTEDVSALFVDITEIKRDWEIFVNGVKQQYKDVALVAYPPDPGDLNMIQYTYFAATNRMYFGLPLESSYVEIKYSRT
jgi:hypothetical protein